MLVKMLIYEPITHCNQLSFIHTLTLTLPIDSHTHKDVAVLVRRHRVQKGTQKASGVWGGGGYWSYAWQKKPKKNWAAAEWTWWTQQQHAVKRRGEGVSLTKTAAQRKSVMQLQYRLQSILSGPRGCRRNREKNTNRGWEWDSNKLQMLTFKACCNVLNYLFWQIIGLN